jgi:phosphatidylethanolamine/phosphatidyl-N-methylethanolamine N-methyltransferase
LPKRLVNPVIAFQGQPGWKNAFAGIKESHGMTVKHIESVYDSYAWIYDLIFGKVFQSGRERAPVLLRLFPGAKLLEVGVGTGLSLPLCARHIEFTGIDLSQKMLNHACRRADELGLKDVRLLKMDATTLEFPDNSFDRVLAAYFISTVPDPVRVIQEMKRVCQPGGYLVFLNHFHSDNPVVRVFERVLSPLFYRLGFKTDLDLCDLMEASGLDIEHLENIDFLGHWKAVRCCIRK